MKAEDPDRGQPDPVPTDRHPSETCPHQGFAADVAVNRLEDTGKFVADIRIRCVQCDEAFRFLGVPSGLRFDAPTVSIDEVELHVPIEPEGQKRLQTSALFRMPGRLKAN